MIANYPNLVNHWIADVETASVAGATFDKRRPTGIDGNQTGLVSCQVERASYPVWVTAAQ